MAGKQRELLKGRVKRLLKAQEDMGQVGEPALRCCVSAIEAFVRDLARKTKAQAESKAVATLTPIELKKAVLASPELEFLHAKVAEIDESAVKYHKAQQRGQKRAARGKEKTTGEKKPRAKKAKQAAETTIHQAASASKKAPEQTETSTDKRQLKSDIDEDDNYDESDSE